MSCFPEELLSIWPGNFPTISLNRTVPQLLFKCPALLNLNNFLNCVSLFLVSAKISSPTRKGLSLEAGLEEEPGSSSTSVTDWVKEGTKGPPDPWWAGPGWPWSPLVSSRSRESDSSCGVGSLRTSSDERHLIPVHRTRGGRDGGDSVPGAFLREASRRPSPSRASLDEDSQHSDRAVSKGSRPRPRRNEEVPSPSHLLRRRSRKRTRPRRLADSMVSGAGAVAHK